MVKMEFRFNEDELIKALGKFFKWVTGKELTEEERDLIASYVMERHFDRFLI